MKVKDLFENVVQVDFSKGKGMRPPVDLEYEQKSQDVQAAYTKIQGEDEKETQTVKELGEFEEWMVTAKKKGRVPGFETMDDVIHYVIAELELPNHITRRKAIEWFSDLDEEDREKARMISHHADRMIQIYDILRNKIHALQDMWHKRFNGKIPSGWDATDGAAWLDSEFGYDILQLKNIKKAFEILGQ